MSKTKPIEAKILFKDNESKELFMNVIDEHTDAVEKLMNAMAPVKGYGNGDASITVLGDEIRVSLIDKDKGTVLSKHGFLPYKEVSVGEKYVVVKEAKPAVFTKTEDDKADVLIGYAPSIPIIYSELTSSVDVKEVIENTI